MFKLLKLKHWQLFLLLFAVPFAAQILIVILYAAILSIEVFFYAFPIMTLSAVAILFGWLYTLGTNLYPKLPSTATMSLTRFKIFLLIPILYITLFSVAMVPLFIASLGESNGQFPVVIAAIIFPLHFISMFCIFYCLYFVAKALRSVELQREVTFNDYAGEFFLFWFSPIGVWVLQPRINKLFDNSAGNDDYNPQILDDKM